MTLRSSPSIAAAISGVLVGAAIVATRSVIDETTPVALAFLRYLIGVCCLFPPILLTSAPITQGRCAADTTRSSNSPLPRCCLGHGTANRSERQGSGVHFARRDLVPIGLLGIAQFGILVVLLNASLRDISSARAALIFATMPLLTMLIGMVFRTERSSLVRTLGVVLTIAGVGFALGRKAILRDGADGAWTGESLAMASAMCGAVCSVLYRPYLRRYPTLPLSAFAMLASVGFLGVLTALEGSFSTLPEITARGWLAVVFIGASSGVGYYLWLWALTHATPTKVTVFLALSPVTAATLGAIFLSEAISTWTLLGLACVALGLWLAHREMS